MGPHYTNELVIYINEMNAEAQKRMDADPTLWVGKMTNDPDHWADYGVYTVDQFLDYLDQEYQHNLEKEERSGYEPDETQKFMSAWDTYEKI